MQAEFLRLAKRRKRTASQELREAIRYWIRCFRKTALHTEALGHMVALVAESVENATGRRWIDDPFTAEAVRRDVEFLVYHFGAFGPNVPAEVPPKVEAAAAKRPPALRELARTPAGVSKAGTIISMVEGAATDPDGRKESRRSFREHWPAEFVHMFEHLGYDEARKRRVKATTL